MYREVRECVHRSRATCGRLGVGWAAQKWWMGATALLLLATLWWPPVAQESTTAQTYGSGQYVKATEFIHRVSLYTAKVKKSNNGTMKRGKYSVLFSFILHKTMLKI